MLTGSSTRSAAMVINRVGKNHRFWSLIWYRFWNVSCTLPPNVSASTLNPSPQPWEYPVVSKIPEKTMQIRGRKAKWTS